MVDRGAIGPGQVPLEAYVRFVQQAVDYGIVFLDREGRICSWNIGAERLHGYSEKEVLGKQFGVFYTGHDIAQRKPHFDLRVAENEGAHEDEGWRVRKDGTMFWANVHIVPLRAADAALEGYVVVIRDLTARRHQEDALRQSEERFRLLTASVKDYAIFMLDTNGHIISWNEGARRLKGYESNEIIGEHFSRFYLKEDVDRGHPPWELEVAKREGRYEEEGWRVRKDGTVFWANVTITAIFDAVGRHIGFAKVTRDLTSRKQTEEELRQRASAFAQLNRELDAFSHTVAHDLRSPIRAVEHLSSVLLEDEAARLSPEGRGILEAMHQSALNMARLVQDLLDFSTAAGRQPTRTEVDLSSEARAVVANLLKQEGTRAIDVVVHDGMRAYADRELIRVALTNLLANAMKFTRKVEPARVEVGQTLTRAGPAFYVRDNGIGFEQEHASRLFQPFSRLEPANEFEGTGIGLATVRRIVERHGGTVWAEAEPGKGATFFFSLPPGP